jgi:endonuclease/exonuclease/phosphatase family metal-dependent hydrolase
MAAIVLVAGCMEPEGVREQSGFIPTDDEILVWSGSDQCRSVVEQGRRLEREAPDAVRVATWNIRWFPWGCSDPESCPDRHTDIPWTACALAWMDADIVALQEILADSAALERADVLLEELGALTSADWRINLHECGADGRQHVGFLWNASRLDVSDFADSAQLNGGSDDANACSANLRPGRYARVQTVGEGVDFHLFSVHFDSGREQRDFDNRRTASGRIPVLEIDGRPVQDSDSDVIVAGDFNTMGRDGTPEVSAAHELDLFDREIAPEFVRLPMHPPCTEYYRNQAGALDHIVVASRMVESAPAARVTGPCAVLLCGDFQDAPEPAYERISDHCPVLVDIQNADEDSVPETG